MNSSSARVSGAGFLIRVGLVGAVLTLAACVAAPGVFRADRASPLLELSDSAGIVVGDLGALPDGAAGGWRDELILALRTANVPAGTAGNRGSYRLDLQASGARLVWVLSDPEGDEVENWPAGDPPDVVAAHVTRLLREDAGPDTGNTPLPPFHVLPVAGLEGRDAELLQVAMRTALRGRGFEPRDEPDPSGTLVFVDVLKTPLDDGRIGVEVTWTVTAGDGAEIGVVEQANAVPAGSLDEGWGQIAPVVAEAAVTGIVDLLRDHAQGRT